LYTDAVEIAPTRRKFATHHKFPRLFCNDEMLEIEIVCGVILMRLDFISKKVISILFARNNNKRDN